ncbi:uncharacterized protein LOC9639058 [Selaginella moellendorffii]|uniref:uncharacterized protein LOC9639058 n=1 Tax=Selaginella moellendorffii TaxID=88036 RepID=UPI000D1C284B|nr:uncharacterized protein LOC9639058 [Selaginella moellendorffii]|eukprot:XP_024537849.1 uncharacterized protein LOC9639058 [Selaginella moellendorffii]
MPASLNRICRYLAEDFPPFDFKLKSPGREFSLPMAAVSKRHARSDGAAMAPGEIPGADADLGLDLSSDIQGILTALQQVRKKAKTDGQKKNEEILNSVKSDILSLADEAKLKSDKERQTLLKAATKLAKECEASLKAEATKYQSIYEKFCKEREDHLRSYEDTFSKFEEGKEALLTRLEQQMFFLYREKGENACE